jgi:DNA-binding SARP family transcriptional activator
LSGKAKTNNPEELRIQLLGEFRISIGDRPIEVAQWRLKKSRSLVKLLALAPGHHLHREQVMELLWPDHDPASAANNLYHTLYVARRILEPSGTHPPSFFQLQDEILSLCPKGPLWIDVEAFQAAVDKAHTSRDPVDYREAIDLYTGDLLPEDLYEDWAGETREMLRQEHLGLLIQLSRLYEERKEYQPAVELSKKVVLIDPLHEQAHLGLMRCYALAGQHQGALK